MENNKKILSYCPNFNKIINADFLGEDKFSLQLVKIYQNFIFKIDYCNEFDVEQVKCLDKTMGKYVDDYFFRKALQTEISAIKIKRSAGDILRIIVDSIINVFRRYEFDVTRKIYISRWI